MEPFAKLAYEFTDKKSDFEEKLFECFGIDFCDIGWDNYDNSLEILGVPNDTRLSEEAQKFIFDNGFSICFVNHLNKWETHYAWKEDFKSHEGFRVRYKHNSGLEKHEVEEVPEKWKGKFDCIVVKPTTKDMP